MMNAFRKLGYGSALAAAFLVLSLASCAAPEATFDEDDEDIASEDDALNVSSKNPMNALGGGNNVLKWFHAATPTNEYVAVHAERYDQATQQWVSSINTWQPFRSTVDETRQQIYWRKDSINLNQTWYGEIFSYDTTSIYLQSETFPRLHWEAAGAWDERKDRFRTYRQMSNPHRARPFAHRTYATTPVSSNLHFKSHLCGVTTTAPGYATTDGFLQARNQDESSFCPVYQPDFVDVKVVLSKIQNYTLPANAAPTPSLGGADLGALPFPMEEALVITQLMNDPQNPNLFSRERFYLGYHQGIYYGIVGWDNAICNVPQNGSSSFCQDENQNYSLTERTLGHRRQQGTTGTAGMIDRVARDRSRPPVATPRTLSADCVTGLNYVRLRWTGAPNQTSVILAVNDMIDGWNPGNGNDFVIDNHPGNSYIFQVAPNRTYDWWLLPKNERGEGPVAGLGIGSTTPTNCTATSQSGPGTPVSPTVTKAGDVVTLSWSIVGNATAYHVRVNNLANGWDPANLAPGDLIVDNHKSNSFTFKLDPSNTQGYNWWVHSYNPYGTSGAIGGPFVTYQAP